MYILLHVLTLYGVRYSHTITIIDFGVRLTHAKYLTHGQAGQINVFRKNAWQKITLN